MQLRGICTHNSLFVLDVGSKFRLGDSTRNVVIVEAIAAKVAKQFAEEVLVANVRGDVSDQSARSGLDSRLCIRGTRVTEACSESLAMAANLECVIAQEKGRILRTRVLVGS